MNELTVTEIIAVQAVMEIGLGSIAEVFAGENSGAHERILESAKSAMGKFNDIVENATNPERA